MGAYSPPTVENDPSGKPSSMRWIVRRVFWLAAVTNGVALVGWILKIDGAIEIIMAASGMLTLITGAKSWQRTHENTNSPV